MISAKVLIPCNDMGCDSGIEDSLVLLKREQEQSDEIEVLGAFINKAEPNSRGAVRIMSEIRHLLPRRALETVIHRDAKLAHCLMSDLGIHELGTRAKIVKEYDQLAEEVTLRPEITDTIIQAEISTSLR